MILKTILIFLVTVLGYSEWALGTSYFQRPIVLGPLVGLIMGDLQAGIVMGATLELAMIGAVSIGAYNPPDLIAGTILGVSLAIQSGANASAALTLGIPIATLLLAANTAIGEPLRLIFIHRCDKNAEDGNYKAFSRNMWIHSINFWNNICSTCILFWLRCSYKGSGSCTGICSDRYGYCSRFTSCIRICNVGTDDDEQKSCTIFLYRIFDCSILKYYYNRCGSIINFNGSYFCNIRNA